jgi:hypothetical protein
MSDESSASGTAFRTQDSELRTRDRPNAPSAAAPQLALVVDRTAGFATSIRSAFPQSRSRP